MIPSHLTGTAWLGEWLQHEADLHSLARALLEQETLNSKQINDILGVQQQQEEPAVLGVSSN